MIALDRVSVNLDGFSLLGADIRIRKGEYHFIMGPSGAGKTVLLETIAGLRVPSEGRVIIRGTDMTGVPPEQRGIALVYQDYSLFPHLTAYENITFGMRLCGVSRQEMDRTAEGLLSRFGLLHLSHRYPSAMSGGEQQRIAIARALANHPDILLLDEPFAAVDPQMRDNCMAELAGIQDEHGLTIVQVSHSRDEAFSLADRVTVITGGIVRQTGTLDEVFARPANTEVARCTGIENIWEGVAGPLSGRYVDLAIGVIHIGVDSPHLTSDEHVIACIRSADVKLRHLSPLVPPPMNGIQGIVREVIPGEYVVRVVLEGPVRVTAAVPRGEAKRIGIIQGKPMIASFDPSRVHIIRG